MPLNRDWLSPELRGQLFGPKPVYRCRCCGESYRKGEFKCCAPPGKMASHVWLAMACPKVEQGGCGKCFEHCTCESKQDRAALHRPLAVMARQFIEDLRQMVKA